MSTLTHFTIDVVDGVATTCIDRAGESLNTLDPSLMADFASVMDRLEADADIRAVVLSSAKPDNFLAGANIKWFAELTDADEAEAAIRQGHALFARLEGLHLRRGKPVVAAIHGACLGGGLELALACSHRIVTDDPKTQLGQPEIQLGVIPAGGGTQRLPALIGIAPALDLILTGRSASPHKAKRLGLADEVVPPVMLAQVARATAIEAIGASREGGGLRSWLSPQGLQKLALETNPMGRTLLFNQARARMLEETKGHYPAPERALEAVQIGVQQGPEAGYRAEARFFGELVTSPESAALRSIFFATRATPETSAAKDVDKVAVLGGGLMGAGFAAVSTLKAGSMVRIKEVDTDGLRRALAQVAKVVGYRLTRKRMSEFEAEQAMLRVTAGTDWKGFSDTDLVIEAVFEDLDVKKSILGEVEQVVRAGTVFGSNTSSLPIGSIAAASSRPETVLGMHYFSPVEKMPLLEVIVTDATAEWAEHTAVAYGRRQGKTVIVVNDGAGFYTTRVLGPYSSEAFHLLAEGASVQVVDAAVEAWGFPVGPFRLADEVGIDVGAKIAVILAEAFGDRMAGPDLISGLVDAGRKGRKNRRGFYSYDQAGKRGGVDETVYDDLGVRPTGQIPLEEIQGRISLAFINEAARCLEEGILRSAADGDVGAVMGLGFPPFRGGPFFHTDQVGAANVVEHLRDLAGRHGPRFEPAQILVDAAAAGTTFRS
ncbi:fatty acid oxidation complex subunit alpha FadJ [soil metagenome]